MKANFRMEIDALNALVDEQRKTNELLQQLIERGNIHELHEDIEIQDDSELGERRSVHGESNQNGNVQPNPRRGKRGPKRNT